MGSQVDTSGDNQLHIVKQQMLRLVCAHTQSMDEAELRPKFRPLALLDTSA